MEQEWFYAEDERSIGPLSSDALIGTLRRMAEPGKAFVWREGFETWRPASDIPELAGRLAKPRTDVVASPDPSLDRWTGSVSQAEVWDDDAAVSVRRRWPQIAAAIALAVAIVGGAMYAPRMFRASGEDEVRVALPGGTARSQPQPAKPDPAVVLAQLTDQAAQAAAATEAISRKLWASIEPPTMQTPPDLATASRSDLEAYLRDLKAAEANAANVLQQYTALLDAEQALIEEAARSSGLDEGSWSDLRAAVNERRGASRERVGRMLQARGNLYRAMQATQVLVIGEFGKYKVGAGGQVRFSSKAATDRAVGASQRVGAANQELDRIEAEMLQARQTSQPAAEPAWKDMVIKEQKGGL